MSSNQPAPEKIISQVVIESETESEDKREKYLQSDLSGRVLFADEIVSAVEILEDIQNIFESNLNTIISSIYCGKADIEVFWESPDHYIIADRENLISRGLEAEIEVPDSVLKIHDRTAHNVLQTYPGIKIDDGQAWVILKPKQWSECELTIDTFVTTLVSAGLSPTQALDYWMVEIRDKHLPRWAEIRGTSPQAIRDNVSRATDTYSKIGGSTSFEPNDYFQRVYEGFQSDSGDIVVTANGGYLPPRRYEYPHSRTGRYEWGYKGAGPTQLAYAILADALGQISIPHGKVTSFRDHLNAHIGDSKKWKVTQEWISEWNEEYGS